MSPTGIYKALTQRATRTNMVFIAWSDHEAYITKTPIKHHHIQRWDDEIMETIPPWEACLRWKQQRLTLPKGTYNILTWKILEEFILEKKCTKHIQHNLVKLNKIKKEAIESVVIVADFLILRNVTELKDIIYILNLIRNDHTLFLEQRQLFPLKCQIAPNEYTQWVEAQSFILNDIRKTRLIDKDIHTTLIYATGTSNGTLIVGYLKNRQCEEKQIVAHTRAITAMIAFQLDRPYIATGSADFTIRIWRAFDASNKKFNPRAETPPFCAHTKGIQSLSYIPNQNSMISLGKDAQVHMWKFIRDTKKLVVQRTMTFDCNRYVMKLPIMSEWRQTPDGYDLYIGNEDLNVQKLNLFLPKGSQSLSPNLQYCTNFLVDHILLEPQTDHPTHLWTTFKKTIMKYDTQECKCVYSYDLLGDIQVIKMHPKNKGIMCGTIQGEIAWYDFEDKTWTNLTIPTTEGNNTVADAAIMDLQWSESGFLLFVVTLNKQNLLYTLYNWENPLKLSSILDHNFEPYRTKGTFYVY